MRNFSTEGLVIKRKNFGEADSLVTIFTKNQGKITSIAKGVRKITSRRAPSLELFNQIKFFLYGNGKLPVLTEAASLQSFPNLKKDLDKLSLAYLILELLDQFLAEGQESQKLYLLLVEVLEEINETEDLEKAKLLSSCFQIKLLREVGYLPELYQCVRCGEKLSEEKNFLAPNLGGLVDENCGKALVVNRPIEKDVIKVIRFLNKETVDDVTKLNLMRFDVAEISQILNYYTVFYLEKDLGAEKFANAVEKLALVS
ncbi:MAG TPA: DNA repair protein RecO [Candidatus Saccharimonadales bacterium]|nr:DNA repair protein RecO [Candidatus Saccharimonadales bacterium]